MGDADPTGAHIDLTECDREPIHLPGAILPHGVMLVLDRNTLEVLQAAGVTEALVGQPLQALLGQTLHSLLLPAQIDVLRSLESDSGQGRPRYLLDPALRIAADRPVDASVYRDGELLVVEFEAADPAGRLTTDPLLAAQEMLEGLDNAASIEAVCQAASTRVRRVTGYDRVMVYRFMEDGSGWVIAESRRDDLTPYLDLHYPAGDIPKQARALYLKNPVRLIAQVDYDRAPLTPPDNPLTGQPLDMSFATLRDVSPVHRQYLRNMGVDASMSVSIIIKGRLWGLIACHHQTPLRLARHLRAVCELFGAMLSLQLDVHDRREQFETRLASRNVLQQLMMHLATEDDYAKGIARYAAKLLEYVRADGLVLFEEETGGFAGGSDPVSFGQTPSSEQIAALVPWLTGVIAGEETVFATDRLGELWPGAEAFGGTGSGLLAVSVSRDPRRFIIWFRSEITQTVTWGGDPGKPVEPGTNGLQPRTSFAAWKQIVHGRSAPWKRSDLDAASDLRAALLEVVLRRIETAALERQRAHEHERLLMSELDHRVKNTLGVIQSLVVQTSRSATSLNGFVNGLDRRIRAMAQSHSLLTRSHWTGVEIRALLHEELDQYGQGGSAISLAGPDALLTPKASLALSLAVHELATNAAKYGALATPHGRVTLTWRRSAGGEIELRWVETGGAAVSPPQQRGFGSKLIEQALAMETGGRSTLHFAPEGVQCDIVLPPAAVVGEASGGGPGLNDQPPETAWTGRKRVLIVEDSSLICMMLEQILEEHEWDMIGPATRVPAALKLAGSERIDAALLDINLDGEMSWEVATELRARGIPFAFSTGYGSGTALPETLTDAPVLKKPFQVEEVEACLFRLLNGLARVA